MVKEEFSDLSVVLCIPRSRFFHAVLQLMSRKKHRVFSCLSRKGGHIFPLKISSTPSCESKSHCLQDWHTQIKAFSTYIGALMVVLQNWSAWNCHTALTQVKNEQKLRPCVVWFQIQTAEEQGMCLLTEPYINEQFPFNVEAEDFFHIFDENLFFKLN